MRSASRVWPGVVAAMACLLWLATAAAIDGRGYEAERFNDDVRSGKTVLVAVHATWCPACARQRPILDQIFAEPAFRDTIYYFVDWDSERAFARAYDVRMQSTLMVFKGGKEVGRLVGETDAERIRRLFALGL